MGYYKDTNASGGGGRNSRGVSFGRPRDGRDRGGRDSGGDREMHKTTCSNCGKACEVPFRPTGAKPVYCNDCFRTMGGNDAPRSDSGRGDRPRRDDRGGDRGDRGARPQPQHLEQFKALNDKLDTILNLLGHVPATKKLKPDTIVEAATFTPLPETSEEPDILDVI